MPLVRCMELRDVDRVSDIERECFSRPWPKQAFLDTFENDAALFLVVEDGDVAGYAGAYISFEEAEITNVAIASVNRKKGLGKLLMEGFHEALQKRGVERILLEVRVSNEPAIELYTKLGYKIIGLRPDMYDDPREDGHLMEINI